MENRNSAKSPKTPPGNIYDTFAKNYLGEVLVFSDFLMNYADEEFVRELDITSLNESPERNNVERWDRLAG